MKKYIFHNSKILFIVIICSFISGNNIPKSGIIDYEIDLLFENNKFIVSNGTNVELTSEGRFNIFKKNHKLKKIEYIFDSTSEKELDSISFTIKKSAFNNSGEVYISLKNIQVNDDNYKGVEYDPINNILRLQRKMVNYAVELLPTMHAISPGSSVNLEEMCNNASYLDCSPLALQKIANLNKSIYKPKDPLSRGKKMFLNNYLDIIKELKWLEEDLIGIIKIGNNESKVNLKWDEKKKIHTFEVWTKSKFTFALSDPRFISKFFPNPSKFPLLDKNRTEFKYKFISLSPYILKEKIKYMNTSKKIEEDRIFNDIGFYLFDDGNSIDFNIDQDFIISGLGKQIKEYKRNTYYNDDGDPNPDIDKKYIENAIKENNLIRLPFVVDEYFKKRIPFQVSSSRIIFDGHFLYVDSKSMIKSDGYENVLISENNITNIEKSWVLQLNRKKERYDVSISPNILYNESNKILSGTINFKNSDRKENIELAYDESKTTFYFDFEMQEPFTLTVSDFRFDDIRIDYNEKLFNNKNRSKRVEFVSKDFLLNLIFKKNQSKKVRNLILFSLNDTLNTFNYINSNDTLQFKAMSWTESPYTIKHFNDHAILDLETITRDNSYNKVSLNKDENYNNLNINVKIYEKIQELYIVLSNTDNVGIENKKVELIEDSKFAELTDNKRIDISDEEGVLFFENIYYIEGLKIQIDSTVYKFKDLKFNSMDSDDISKYYNLTIK